MKRLRDGSGLSGLQLKKNIYLLSQSEFPAMRSGLQIRVRYRLFPNYLTKTYVVGIQKNRLNETVLLSTQNTC